jgi:CDP-diacylglycerol--serine O-phosphatidyltransferase
VAPAVLAFSAMGGISVFARPGPSMLSRLYLALGVIYVGCAAVRLARFNVVTTLEEESHQEFIGLPSPAAAGVVASLVIAIVGLSSSGSLYGTVLVRFVLPGALVLVSVLMVSRVRYAHLLYDLSKRGRGVALVAEILFAGAIVALLRELALAVLFAAYVLSGLVGLGTDRVLGWLESSEADSTSS